VTNPNPNTDKILAELSKEIFNGNEVSIILGNPKEFPTELIEKLSLTTALQYWNEKIEYEDGDCIMNNIYNFWVTNEYYFNNYGLSDIALECFEAFDSGEYLREDDEKNIDPSEKYTRPLIENLLKKRELIK
jgi:alpha-L-fucosidase